MRRPRHCERSEAIQDTEEGLDCFVRYAPRNVGTQRSLENGSARGRHIPSASAISPRVPTITRHQANSVKPWRVT